MPSAMKSRDGGFRSYTARMVHRPIQVKKTSQRNAHLSPPLRDPLLARENALPIARTQVKISLGVFHRCAPPVEDTVPSPATLHVSLQRERSPSRRLSLSPVHFLHILVLALPVWKVPETAASSGPVTGEEVFFFNLHSYTVTAKGKKSNIEVPISFKPEAMLGHAVKPAVFICSVMSPRNQGARQKSGLRMTDSSEWCKHCKYRIRLGIRRTGKSRDPIVELYSFKFEL